MAATADAPAVRDLNLQIADGEFMVLVGPSGCGKTTALRMVAGLEDITAGELRIGGTVVNDCVDAPPVVTDEVLELAADLGKDEASRFEQRARQGRNEFIARVDPKTEVSMGDTITFSVDTAQLHFFDPATGEVVR